MKAWNARASILAVSLLAGSVHGLAFGALYSAALQLVAFAVLGGIVFLLRSQRHWGLLLLCCAAFWLATYTLGLRWIADTLTAPDMLGLALGSLVYGMLVTGLSCPSILCLWAATVAAAPIRADALCCALLSSALLVSELLREQLLPSFPWLSVGYAHTGGLFSALLPLIGAQGLSWIVQLAALLVGALAVSIFRTHELQMSTTALGVVIVVGTVVLPALLPPAATPTREAPSFRVAAMQTAIPVREKFRASLFARHLAEVGEFARTHDAELILTPETAVPTSLRALTQVQQQFLSASITASRALLFGAFAEDSRGDVFNSAVLLQRIGGEAAAAPATAVLRTVYIKQHLAPIGEYAPPGFRWVADLLHLPVSNRRSTQDTAHNFMVSGITIIPSICQDLLYGDDLRTTTDKPRLLVNLSNVAFFRNPLARAQFLDIARARAQEQQVPVLIAANYGPTAFIDATGVVERELPADVPGALEVTVHPRTGTTVYARSGNLFLDLALVMSFAASLGYWVKRIVVHARCAK